MGRTESCSNARKEASVKIAETFLEPNDAQVLIFTALESVEIKVISLLFDEGDTSDCR